MNTLTSNRMASAAEASGSGFDLKVKPRLPKECFEKSLPWTAVFIVYALCAYTLPVAGIYEVVEHSAWPWIAKIIVVFFLGIVAQQGLHLLGWVGHEGFHFNLHRNRRLSAIVGIFFSSMVGTFMEIGAAISHLNHHRFTNREGDPDIPLFTRYRTLPQRMMFARMAANRQYLRNTIRLALGKPVAYATRLPFRDGEVRLLARLNIVLSIMWLGIYAGIIWHAPLAGAVAIVLPHFLGILYTGTRSYLEHAGTETGLFRNSRTRMSSLTSAVYFFNNYHLEHHLYPYVPCYRLPKVHRFLAELGYYSAADAFVEHGVMHNYAYATGRFQYPAAK